uniref:Uncharacterized protein n=1 Tax=viral metagenome TaxID=1070528 RepID=A0A6M3LI59_9ZZZZ
MSKEVTREEMLEEINRFIKPGCPYGAKTRRKLKAIRALIEHGPEVDEAWLIDAADAALVALKHRYRSRLTALDTIAMRDILTDVLEAAGVRIRGEK